VRISGVLALALALTSCAHAECPIAGARANACNECAPDLVRLAGACVTPRVADAYCGKGARFAGGRCVYRACAAGQLLDLATGECAASRSVRALASSSPAACARGEAPVLEGSRLACVREPLLCPRGTRPHGDACVVADRCGAGEVEAESGACESIAAASPSHAAHVVDVARWLRAVVGADGGEGRRDLCAPLALRSGGAARKLTIAIALRFPANQVADAHAAVAAFDAETHVAAQPETVASVRAIVAPLVDALRALGGESSAAALDVAVTCSLGVSLDHP
jgi:hypothetical protein